ncbi:hypothetical protein L0152_21880, partial [bacterium]|nr:hypothetical protein [bacterium]
MRNTNAINCRSYLSIGFVIGKIFSNIVRLGFLLVAFFYMNGIVHAITASPNPCIASACDPLCTSNISWSQGNEVTEIWVSVNGGAEAYFSCPGDEDTYIDDAPFIGCGNSYVFSHYHSSAVSCPDGINGTTKQGLIGSVTVTGQGCNTGIEFDIDDDECEPNDQTCIDNRKVLISNKGTLPYTSVYQEGLPGTNPEKDRKIKITGSTSPNTDFWVRVADPDDPSPYEPDPEGLTDDNVDQNGPWENGAEFEGCSDSSCGAKKVTSDQNGNFETVMTVTNRYAGDNYKVQGAFDEEFSCSPGCCLSGTITAWKREYVEKDRMYRRGGLLYESFLGSSCSPNCNKIKVYSWSNVNVGDVIVVFDQNSTSQQKTVTAKPPSTGPYATLTLGAPNLTG